MTKITLRPISQQYAYFCSSSQAQELVHELISDGVIKPEVEEVIISESPIEELVPNLPINGTLLGVLTGLINNSGADKIAPYKLSWKEKFFPEGSSQYEIINREQWAGLLHGIKDQGTHWFEPGPGIIRRR